MMSTILEIDTEDLVRGARFVKPALDRARGDHPALHLNHADLRLRDGKLQLTATNGRVLLTWELEHKLVDLNQDKFHALLSAEDLRKLATLPLKHNSQTIVTTGEQAAVPLLKVGDDFTAKLNATDAPWYPDWDNLLPESGYPAFKMATTVGELSDRLQPLKILTRYMQPEPTFGTAAEIKAHASEMDRDPSHFLEVHITGHQVEARSHYGTDDFIKLGATTEINNGSRIHEQDPLPPILTGFDWNYLHKPLQNLARKTPLTMIFRSALWPVYYGFDNGKAQALVSPIRMGMGPKQLPNDEEGED